MKNFSGKTNIAVKQDFNAKVYMMSFTASMAFPIAERVKKEFEESKNKHIQQINRTSAYSMMQNISIGMLLGLAVQKAIEAIDSIVYHTREIVRPGRQNPRKKHPPKLYHMNYKRL